MMYLPDYRLHPPEPPRGYEEWAERQWRDLRDELKRLLATDGLDALIDYVYDRWPKVAWELEREGKWDVYDIIYLAQHYYPETFSVEDYNDYCEAARYGFP